MPIMLTLDAVLPKNIEPYQLAILQRMNTMGDNGLFSSKKRNTTGFLSRQNSSGSDTLEYPIDEGEQFTNRLGGLSVSNVQLDEEGN